MKMRWVDVPAKMPAELRGRVERRVRLVVGRKAPIIDVVAIGLSEPPPHDPFAATVGDRLHRCRIRIRLVGGDGLVVEEQAATRDAAIEAATWRLSRRLARLDARPASRPAVARGSTGTE